MSNPETDSLDLYKCTQCGAVWEAKQWLFDLLEKSGIDLLVCKNCGGPLVNANNDTN
jgi:DNA-directed RNA polymerase subunit RPC12/RpoP